MNFQRATRDRWISGVCGGIAHQMGWSSNLVRLIVALFGVVVPGVSTLAVAVVYIILVFILPESPEF